MDSVDNITFIGSHCQLAYNLTLGENGTSGTDSHFLPGHGAESSQIFNLYFQNTRHNIQEPSRSCRTLVIHLEIGHCTIIYMQNFYVLSTNINDSVDIWKQKSCTLGMAGKLAHLFIGNAIHQRGTAVACCQRICHVFLLHACLI